MRPPCSLSAALIMTFGLLNKVCFAIAVVSIVAGALLSLVKIWTPFLDDDRLEQVWRMITTVSVVFLASFATLSVSRTSAEPVGLGRVNSAGNQEVGHDSA